MKRLQIFICFFIILFSFSACKKEQQQKTEPEPETEAALYTIEQENVSEPADRNVIFVTTGEDEIMDQSHNKEILNIPGVQETEFYGGAARVSYFFRRGTDYSFDNEESINKEYFKALDGLDCSRYIMSAQKLTEEDLSAGSLPSAMNEIVLYSSDESVIGKTLEMYFCNYYDFCNDLEEILEIQEKGYIHNFMSGVECSEFIEKDMKITGILKEQTSQVYFSESFCDMMCKVVTDIMYPFVSAEFFGSGELSGIKELDGTVGPEGNYRIGEFGYSDLPWKDSDYINLHVSCKEYPLVYADETLTEQEAGVSKFWIELKEYTANDSGYETGIYNLLLLTYNIPQGQEPDEAKGPGELETVWVTDHLNLMGTTPYSNVIHGSGKGSGRSYIVQKICGTLTKSDTDTLAVNQEIFRRIHNYEGTKAIAVYIEPEQETQIRQALQELGYQEYSLPKVIW